MMSGARLSAPAFRATSAQPKTGLAHAGAFPIAKSFPPRKNRPDAKGGVLPGKRFTAPDKSRGAGGPDGKGWLWGVHPVLAALANPERRIQRLVASEAAGARLASGLKPDIVETDYFKTILPPGAVHQGLAVKVEALESLSLEETCDPPDRRPVLVLDQVSDPQNVGAMFRCAAAFDVRAIVQQDRHAPPVTGFLAKAAAGAIETVPDVRVVNIARSIEALNDMGYLTIGLAGESAQDLAAAVDDDRPIALVIGAEGEGLRDLVARTCTRRGRIPISKAMESLNASAACAIALYEATRRVRAAR